jgi:phosphoribosylformylglycinamidine synthase subunit PurS
MAQPRGRIKARAALRRGAGLAIRAASLYRLGATTPATRKRRMKARVTVTLKNGVLDPQGKAIEGALRSLGIAGVDSVRQGKVFDVELASQDKAGAEAALQEACEKLLANTVIENYRVEITG